MATIEDVYKFIKEETGGVYYLATSDGDQPRVRVFGTFEWFEDKIYILTGKDKEVYKQIAANRKVEICACNEADWLRITGTLADDDRVEAKKHMLDARPDLRVMYDENDENTIVLYIDHATAKFESLASPETDTAEW